MGESVVIPLIIDPKAGVAGLRAFGEQAKRTQSNMDGLSGTSGKFATGIKSLGNNLLQLAGIMKVTELAGKILGESFDRAVEQFMGLGKASNILSGIQTKAVDSTRAEVFELKNLYSIASDTSKSYQVRQAAIDKMNASYPSLHENMKLETIANQENKKAVDDLVASLIAKAKLDLLINSIASMQAKTDALKKTIEGMKGGWVTDAFKNLFQQGDAELQKLTAEANSLFEQLLPGDKSVEDYRKKKAEEAKRLHDKQLRDYEQYVRETISKGKALATEMKGILEVPKFSAFDTEQEQFKKAKDFLNAFGAGRQRFRIPVDIDIQFPPEEVKAEGLSMAEMFGKTWNEYWKGPGNTDNSLIKAMADESLIMQNSQAIYRMGGTFGEFFSKAFVDQVRKDQLLGKGLQEAMTKAFAGIIVPMTALQALENSFSQFIDAVASGQNVMKAFGQMALSTIKQIITGFIKAAFSAALISLITGGAKGGGLSFIKALTGVLGGPKPFAEGGLVTGPVSALIGEGRGTSASNPEVVAPLDKLKSFFAGMLPNANRGFNSSALGMAGTVLQMPSELILRAHGRDMVAVLSMEQKRQGRVG